MVVDVVGEGSMVFHHMVICMYWPHTWVSVERVGENGTWTQSTH
jgi:hypothetical protein